MSRQHRFFTGLSVKTPRVPCAAAVHSGSWPGRDAGPAYPGGKEGISLIFFSSLRQSPRSTYMVALQIFIIHGEIHKSGSQHKLRF